MAGILGATLVTAGCTRAEVLAVQSSAQPSAVHSTAHAPVSEAQLFLQLAAALHNTPFLACTRAHESDTAGGYRAYNPEGPYYGAYQYLQGTWNYAAGRWAPQYVGWNPINVPGFWQDYVTWDYYLAVGNGPWAGRC